MTIGDELKALDVRNNSGLWLTLMTLGLKIMDLNAMNTSGF